MAAQQATSNVDISGLVRFVLVAAHGFVDVKDAHDAMLNKTQLTGD